MGRIIKINKCPVLNKDVRNGQISKKKKKNVLVHYKRPDLEKTLDLLELMQIMA